MIKIMRCACKPLLALILFLTAFPEVSRSQVRWDPPVISIPGQANREMELRRAAQNAEALRDYERALNFYRQLKTLGARWEYYYRGELRCLLTLTRYEEAAAMIRTELSAVDRSLSQAHRKTELLVDLGEVYLSQGDEEEAWKSWNEALTSRRSDPQVYRSISGALLRARKVNEAVEILRRGEKTLGEQVFANDLAMACVAMMDYKGAVRYFLKQLKHQPAQYKYIERMIYNLSSGEGTSDSVIEALEEAMGDPQANPAAAGLLAGCLFSLGRYDQALKQTIAADVKGVELTAFAASVNAEGRFDLALEAYRAALSKLNSRSPQRAEVLTGMAEALDKLGRYMEALEIYREVMGEYSGNLGQYEEAAFRIGEIYLERFNNPDSAEAYYYKLRGGRRGGETGLALGKCALVRGDIDEALDRYTSLTEPQYGWKPEIMVQANLMIGRCLFWNGKVDSALKVWNGLARFQPKSEAANDALRDALTFSEVKDSALVKVYAAAWLQSAQKRYSEAVQGFSAVSARSPGTVIGSRAVLEAAEALRELSECDSAAKTLEMYIQSHPQAESRDEIFYLLGNIYLIDVNDPVRAGYWYEHLLVETPDSPLAPVVRRKLESLQEVNL